VQCHFILFNASTQLNLVTIEKRSAGNDEEKQSKSPHARAKQGDCRDLPRKSSLKKIQPWIISQTEHLQLSFI
jgi:hypothetical protein